jgi:hypothetical protein
VHPMTQNIGRFPLTRIDTKTPCSGGDHMIVSAEIPGSYLN